MNGSGFKCALNSLGLLLARVALGYLMLFGHGLGKIEKFNEYAEKFADPFGVGSRTSLILCIIGEVVAPAMIALGLLTRPAALIAAFNMGVAAFWAHAADPLFVATKGMPAKEFALLYLIPFALFFFTGPGLISLDALIFRRKGACATGSATSSTTSATPQPPSQSSSGRNMV